MPNVIKEFMTKNVVTVDNEDSVFDAAEAMTQDPDVAGYVVVLAQGKPIGIVTERDIVHKVIAHHISKLVVVKDDILYGVITAKVVATQCTTYVHQTVHDVMRWTGFGS
jgi:CBS domain-containing protein